MNVRSFLGSEPSKGSGSRSLGLADEEFDLTRLLIALARELASASLSTGSFCAELGCAEDIGAGDAGGIAGVELPDGSSKVNSSCARAFWAVRVFRVRGSVGMKRVVGWMFEYTVRVCALHHSMEVRKSEGFRRQLQLVRCTYLLSQSEYFKYRQSADCRSLRKKFRK